MYIATNSDADNILGHNNTVFDQKSYTMMETMHP